MTQTRSSKRRIPLSKRNKKKGADTILKFSDPDEITPRPAFRKFELTDERNGKRRLRDIGKGISLAKRAPNAVPEIMGLFDDAMEYRVPWICYRNRSNRMILREKRPRIEPEEAIENLFIVAQTAVAMLENLAEKRPDLCSQTAEKKSEWPVLADMTEKDWRRTIADQVTKLKVGRKIEGYLLSARTADENVIRCFATAIFETLFQTRFDFREAAKRKNKYRTTKGCPAWARKTSDLPPFTKANSARWAKLGEEMLLEQVPDFLNMPDLGAKHRSWTQRAANRSRSGRVSETAIQREAFNDFAKELKKLAPEELIFKRRW